MSYKIGYARVSTDDQSTADQVRALTEAGCDEVFEEQMSGIRRDRPQLEKALERLRPGDVLTVWKTDRLARSLSHLLEVVEGLNARGINFQSLTEGFDTTTPGGKAFFQICGTMAELERNLIQERVQSGLKRARQEGRIGGRPRVEVGRVEQALAMIKGGMSVNAAAKVAGISRASVYRAQDVSKTPKRANGHAGGFETSLETDLRR